MSWINVKDRLPADDEIVLAYSSVKDKSSSGNGTYAVCHFLEMKGLHFFCSKEIPGNILRDITHWKKLTSPED